MIAMYSIDGLVPIRIGIVPVSQWQCITLVVEIALLALLAAYSLSAIAAENKWAIKSDVQERRDVLLNECTEGRRG